eukprot:TRINITY_DN4438_c0_g1_i1.p1 TRINITY_DN4438_c0_g1~~TRINITY_DN4438_c0_g1_i1.p1  ORF type:complete len:387 (-),score=135.25 TRINITY_DN4438_c0_g1_i1:144-1205(-)
MFAAVSLSKVPSSALCRGYNSEALSSTVARFERHGPPTTVVGLSSEPLPDLAQGQVLLKFLSSSVSLTDISRIRGGSPGAPGVAGEGGVAQVVSVGADVDSVKVGDIVTPSAVNFGTWRTAAIVAADSVVAIPSSSPSSAPTLALLDAALTARSLLKNFVRLQSGDVVLHNGADSLVGRAVIQLASSVGVRVVSVIADEANETVAKELSKLGSSLVLRQNQLRTAGAKIRLEGDVVLALDAVGGPSATEFSRLMLANGTFVAYAKESIAPITVPTSIQIFNNITLRGFSLPLYKANTSPADISAAYEELLSLVGSKKLSLPSPQSFKLSQVKEALAKAEESRDRDAVLLSFEE